MNTIYMEENISYDPTPDLAPPKKPLSIKLLVSIIVVLAIALVSTVYILVKNQIYSTKNKDSLNTNDSQRNASVTQASSDFFYFAIPKPFEKLTVLDLPNNGNVKGAVKIDNHLWFTGSGSIIEYDITTGALVSYSDPKKSNCDNSIVYVNGYLYASCRIDNVFDAFGDSKILTTENFTGHYGILKINPKTHTLERIFTKKDGLLNGYNYRLYVDGDYLWITTFNGIARINSKTDEVNFYTQELNISESLTYNAGPILIDKDHIWVEIKAHANSKGGLALFNKSTSAWEGFGVDRLKDEDKSRFDLQFSEDRYAMKIISGGIQIGFNDGRIGNQQKYIEKQYSYQTRSWTKLYEAPATGDEYKILSQHIKSTYPITYANYNSIDQQGFTQIKMPDSGEEFIINGRDSLLFSPTIDGKRYILTRASVDVIDDTSPFRQLVVKLGNGLVPYIETDIDSIASLVEFMVDVPSRLAIVIDSGCGGMECTDQKIWLIDLTQKKILKKYTTTTDSLPEGELLNDLHIQKDSEVLKIITKDNRDLFTIDMKTLELHTLINQ